MSSNNSYSEKRRRYAWSCYFKERETNHKQQLENAKLVQKIFDLTEAEADSIPSHVVSELKELYKETKKQVQCPICWEVVPVDKLDFTKCGHKYCKPCLDQWKEQKPTCCVCRKPLKKRARS